MESNLGLKGIDARNQKDAKSDRSILSSLVPLFQNKSKFEAFHFHANQSHFHKNGLALRLALKAKHKGTRKWPI